MANYFSSFLPDYYVLELQNKSLNQFWVHGWTPTGLQNIAGVGLFPGYFILHNKVCVAHKDIFVL